MTYFIFKQNKSFVETQQCYCIQSARELKKSYNETPQFVVVENDTAFMTEVLDY